MSTKRHGQIYATSIDFLLGLVQACSYLLKRQGCDSSFKSETEFGSSSKKWPELKDI